MDDCIIDALAVVIEANAADARRVNGIGQFDLLSGDPRELGCKPFLLTIRHGYRRHGGYRHNAMILIVVLTEDLNAAAELTDIALFHQNLEEIELTVKPVGGN